MYNECVRPFFGVDHQMAIAVTATPSHVVGLTVARAGRDFSERDRRLLDLLRPHVMQVRRTIERLERLAGDVVAFARGTDAAGVGLVRLTRRGRVRMMTSRARAWLEQYLGRAPTSTRLPDVLHSWVLACERVATLPGDPPTPLEPLAIHGARGTLRARFVPDEGGALLRLDEYPSGLDREALGQLGLTPRETDVLVWVAAGKTSAEIGLIVGARLRTVEKHLERIYRKLGVENRTAAAGVVRSISSRLRD